MVPILDKSIRILQAIATGQADGSINRLARDLGIAPATCYRILQTLEQADWIRPRPGGGFDLSGGLTGMLHPLGHIERLVDAVAQPLADLAQQTELAVKMSVRQGDHAFTAFRAESPRAMALVSRVGAQFPLAIGSSGAVLCSGLSEPALQHIINTAPDSAWKNQTPDQFRARIQQCRANRTCTDRGSFHPQVHTISGPLHGSAGDVLASVTLIGLPDDLTDQTLPSLRTQLIHTLDICTQRVATYVNAQPIGGAA